ncbi:Flavinator of succinate dehydrogenase-domain-containing protein [Absidia repens]|uniref:Succinate dehydrogenase assembly factor 2, mitochondrial n=1 Tax=Absidia repens TaxID=90262 RepID=A0A1X2ISP6_9FUNG|nr:Flavinator of succinate dehydrogenase-domain-containing protein [Absidia repens]
MLPIIARRTVLYSSKRTLTYSASLWNNNNGDSKKPVHKYQDPFPDLAIRHSPNMDIETPYANLEPIPRPNESEDKKRARLLYQSRKRGILETDLLLSTFAKQHLSTFSMAQLEEYDSLLDEPDWDIFYWATFKKPHPENWKNSKVLEMICQHAKNKDKKVLRMPDLSQ